jgi:cytochrome c553
MQVKKWLASVVMLSCGLSSAHADSAKTAKSAPLPKHAQEVLSSRCSLCHGMEGESASAVYPRLAAQHPDYLRKQLADFREGRRKSDTMGEMAKDLQDEDIAALAGYFSGKPAGARQPGDADLAAVGKYIFTKGNRFSGVPACASCHGPGGYGTDKLPRLAGQHPAYIETQLKEFNNRERTNDNAIMQSVASKLTELEVKALSVYIGGLQ